ncbi:hypothetical protein GM30_15790 [Trabulsiella odontotermitis]|nr:hypothetical protein GM30_15790 [Trabulsiella odontotermitis]
MILIWLDLVKEPVNNVLCVIRVVMEHVDRGILSYPLLSKILRAVNWLILIKVMNRVQHIRGIKMVKLIPDLIIQVVTRLQTNL